MSLRTAPALGSGADDAFSTAYTRTTGSLTAGVEVQATVLDNLKHGLFINPAPRSWGAGLLLASALVAAAVLRRGTTWRAAAAASGIGFILLAGSWIALRYGRVWMPPLLPLLALGGAVISCAGLDLARERRARRQVSQAFGQYLAPELVRRLARDPAKLRLGGERRTLTVLFCDLRGFTTLSERLEHEPERLTTLMNRVLDALTAPVLAEGGTIGKYIGDCVMAFWNAPLPCADHAAQGLRAAFGMIDAIAALNDELTAEARREGRSPVHLAVGIGINTGPCVVGNLGSRWRFAYSALGDAVNTAARLEALSKDYALPLILGPATAEAVGAGTFCIEIDRVTLRGRSIAGLIYTALRCPPDRPEVARALHHRLMERRAGGDDAQDLSALLRSCRSLLPELSPYYDVRFSHLESAPSGAVPQQAVATG